MEALVERYGFLFVTVLQQALLGLSLYFPLMAGQLSLASLGFYALGGYVTAIMSTNAAFAAWRDGLGPLFHPLEWLIALAASAVLGVVLGYPALRLRGIYLALATIAFVQVVGVAALNCDVAGGAVGIFGLPQIFESRLAYVWFFGPLLAAAMLLVWRVERSGFGRTLFAIREDELAARAMGVPVTTRKVQAFVLGCMLAGITGAMSAPFLNTWNSRQGTFDASVGALAYVLIGGARSKWGPILGAALLVSLPEALRPLKDSRMILNGLVLVAACVYLPNGLAGLFAKRGRP